MKLEEIQVITSTWTVYEALTVIKGRVGYRAAEELWKVICDPELVFLIKVTEDVEAEALWLFFNYRDKVWGIVDCANLIIMEKLGCRQALAFDRHFEEAANQRGFVVRRA
jgi:predicted nucleic acid-binding protein